MRCLLNAYNCDISVVIMVASSRNDQILIMHIKSFTSKMEKATLGCLACGSLHSGEGFLWGQFCRQNTSLCVRVVLLLAWRSKGKRLKNWKCILENVASPLGCPCADAVNQGRSGLAQPHRKQTLHVVDLGFQ